MPIELGIDVDSTDVLQADAAVDRLSNRLRDAQGKFVGVGKASAGADRAIRGAADGATQMQRRADAAIASMGKMTNSLGGLRSMAMSVQGVFYGFIGGSLIKGLMDTTMQLQKIDMTFQAVTGSASLAAEEMAYVTETADKLGQNVLTAAGAYAKILAASQASNIPLTQTRNLFEGITAAATAFGLSQYELEGALNAVQQMISKGSVQAEELRGQLGERLPGAFSIAADAMGMTVQQLSKQLELGNVSATEFVSKFGPELQKRFGGFAAAAETSGRAVNELDNAFLELKKTIISGGFQEALIKTLDTLTNIVASEEAATVARGIGMAFKFMADNAALAALALGGLGLVFAPFGGFAILIAGVTAAIIAWTQETTKLGEENVKNGEIITETWNGVVREIKAGTDLAVAAWDWMVAQGATIPERLARVWANMRLDFLNLVKELATIWRDFVQFIVDHSIDIPGFESGLALDLSNANLQVTKFGTSVIQTQGEIDLLNQQIKNGTVVETEKLAAAAKTYADTVQNNGLNSALSHITANHAAAADKAEKLNALHNTQAGIAKKRAAAEENIAASTSSTAKAAGKAAKAQDDMVKSGRQILEDARELAKVWEGVYSDIADAMLALQAGGDVKGSATSVVQSISDAMWGDQMKVAMEDMAQTWATKLKGVFDKLGQSSGLSGTAVAGVGMGIANTAIGVMNQDAGQIGSGIGSAAGAVLGSFIPGIGTVLGSMLGGALGGAVGGGIGGGSKFAQVSGTAFEGMSYAQAVRTANDYKERDDAAHQGQIAFQGVVALLGNFNDELKKFVEEAGGTVRRNTEVVVDQTAALKAITGVLDERGLPGLTGSGGVEAGERIAAKVAEIMGVAAAIVQTAGPPLTEAQVLWRETQKRFSATNVAILRDLGFTTKQILGAQREVQTELRQGFNQEMLTSLVDLEAAAKPELRAWRNMELRELEERRIQAIKTAREIGASTRWVNLNFRAQGREIEDQFKELVKGLNDVGEAAEISTKKLDRLTDNLTRLESRRAEVLTELTKRANEARTAEEALANARAGLKGSELNPGGPMDRFNALQSQFNAAIRDAMGGDASAAQRAAGLASGLLTQGRSVYASGGDYAALFRMVNQQLGSVQEKFDNRADKLEKTIDAATFTEVTERSTQALLRALSHLDDSIKHVSRRIDNQTRKIEIAEQKNRTGKAGKAA